MVCVLNNVLGFFEAAGTMQFFQCGERAADSLLGGVDDPLERFSLSRCAAGVPYAHAVCEDALYGGTVEGHQQTLSDVIPPEYSQKEQPLLGFFQQLRGAPGQAVFYVDSKKAEVCYPLHTLPVDK